MRDASFYARRVCALTIFSSLFGSLSILSNLIGRWKGTGRKIALFIPAATKIILVAVFAYTSWYKGGYNGLIRVLFSRAVTIAGKAGRLVGGQIGRQPNSRF